MPRRATAALLALAASFAVLTACSGAPATTTDPSDSAAPVDSSEPISDEQVLGIADAQPVESMQGAYVDMINAGDADPALLQHAASSEVAQQLADLADELIADDYALPDGIDNTFEVRGTPTATSIDIGVCETVTSVEVEGETLTGLEPAYVEATVSSDAPGGTVLVTSYQVTESAGDIC